jgi:hypothetical protein
VTPVQFPESNRMIGPPAQIREDLCSSIPACIGHFNGGPWDGADSIVVAWKPTIEELAQLNRGGPIYVHFIGGVPPHCLSTHFPLIIEKL